MTTALQVVLLAWLFRVVSVLAGLWSKSAVSTEFFSDDSKRLHLDTIPPVYHDNKVRDTAA